MTIQFILILVSLLMITMLYGARLFSKNNGTILFRESFLLKADEAIFGAIKFVFKMYSLLSHNIVAFLSSLPHAVLDLVHKISHALAQYTHALVEKFKNNKKK